MPITGACSMFNRKGIGFGGLCGFALRATVLATGDAGATGAGWAMGCRGAGWGAEEF